MTDNEIVEALECCLETSGVNCGKCPYCDNCVTDENTSLVMTDALDLINRQKAEIETKDIIIANQGKIIEELLTNMGKVATEAYREFAERLEKEIFIKQNDKRKQMLEILKTDRGTRNYFDAKLATDNWLLGYGEAVRDILVFNKNFLKELVGDDDG